MPAFPSAGPRASSNDGVGAGDRSPLVHIRAAVRSRDERTFLHRNVREEFGTMRASSRFTAVAACVLVFGLVTGACSSNDNGNSGGSGSGGSSTFQGTGLTGAGSTFAEPIYSQWASDFGNVESDAKVNYQAIGSGGGVQQFTSQTVDFGATDAPLQPDEMKALPAAAIEIPTVIGGIAIAYHVQGLSDGLKLDGATAADIFLGKITSWNDPAIASQNPGVSLPATKITVVHRSDESGSTFVFTSWLSQESSDWSDQVGADTTVKWPAGLGGNGSDGVAATMNQNDGSISYLSYDVALASKLNVATVKADDGTYVAPSVDSISKAGSILKFPVSPDTNILNAKVKGAYPIATTTYVLLYTDQSDKTKGQTLVDLFTWGLTTGQDEAAKLNYAPLPSQVQSQAMNELAKVTSGGSPITASSTIGQ
jgi:phosphate transport system substrate-binding protein